jgi:hypothetical protein
MRVVFQRAWTMPMRRGLPVGRGRGVSVLVLFSGGEGGMGRGLLTVVFLGFAGAFEGWHCGFCGWDGDGGLSGVGRSCVHR